MKAQKILVIDTETCSLSRDVYDVGFVVANRKGEIFETFTGLVEENFENARKMMEAFYARKIFEYYARAIQNRDISLMPWANIVAAIRNAVLVHDVGTVAAYNLGFDMRVMKATHADLGDSNYIIPKATKILDLWQFACEARLNNATYRKLAHDMGWVSDKGNVKTGAEFAYRYITGDWNFRESHTALHDAEIETEIMRACFARRKKIPYGIINKSPWRLVQNDS